MQRPRLRRARPTTNSYTAPRNRAERRYLGPNRPTKHTFRLINARGAVVLIHSTMPSPWTKKANNRRRDRIAAASRKANR